MRSSVVISERDRFRGAASSLDVGAGRLEEVDEEGDDGDDSGCWYDGDDGRARLEELTEVESTIAITLGE